MTRIRTILGEAYDAPAELPAGLEYRHPKASQVEGALRRAELSNDVATVELLHWELGLLYLVLGPADGVSPYAHRPYERFAQDFRVTSETVAYARERASETQDVILRLHYLEYVLLRSEPRGKQWIELQRQLLATYREYVDESVARAIDKPDEHVGVYVERALTAVGRMLRRGGLIPTGEHGAWADWLVRLAEASRAFPVKDPDWVDQQRHRWIADYLEHLSALPPEAASPQLRAFALGLVEDATRYYQSTPLNDNFEHRVAEVEATLRKHWGEAGAHERMIRRQVDAPLRRAELHRITGSGMLTAHFLREARALMEQHRQYFTPVDIARLQIAEQSALNRAVEAGEFTLITVPIEIPAELMDYTHATPEETVAELVEQAVAAVPVRSELFEEVRAMQADAPLQGLIKQTVVGAGKVVGETVDPEGNVPLEVEQRAMFTTRLFGEAVSRTLMNAAGTIGLKADHVVAALDSLDLDDGTFALVRHGLDRLVAQDFVSATHILVPRVEDVLRQHLRALGVNTTEFISDVGDGTSRTDDAPLGALMRRSLPDDRTVKDYLGPDLWDHLDSVLNSQTGLNLRNDFAHGLSRPRHCTSETAGVTVSLLFQLSAVARAERAKRRPHGLIQSEPSEGAVAPQS